jgi:RecB family exonuclease
MWDMENPMGNIHFGNQLHTILGEIRYHKDAPEVLRHAFSSGLAAPEEKQRVTAVLQQVLTHPDLSPCYREPAEVKTEPEILLPDGHVFRPDRVVLQGRNAILIEYKTGKKSLYHREQLLRYEELLLQMGYDKVKKLLVYLYETIEVVEI